MNGLELHSLSHIFWSGRTTGDELHGIKISHLHLLSLYAHVGHAVRTNAATKKEIRLDTSPAHENGALAMLARRNARRRRVTTMETQIAAPHAVVDCRLAHSNREAQAPPPQTANINARTTSCLRLMSYDHLFASEQTPSLHLKIDNEGALGNVPSTPTKKTSTNLVFARNMPTKRGRWGRERERE